MTLSEYRIVLHGTYFGPILEDVASQALVESDCGVVRLPKWAWHDYFKRACNDGRSTTVLDDREFSLYIIKVEAQAATVLSVEFTPLEKKDG